MWQFTCWQTPTNYRACRKMVLIQRDNPGDHTPIRLQCLLWMFLCHNNTPFSKLSLDGTRKISKSTRHLWKTPPNMAKRKFMCLVLLWACALRICSHIASVSKSSIKFAATFVVLFTLNSSFSATFSGGRDTIQAAMDREHLCDSLLIWVGICNYSITIVF